MKTNKLLLGLLLVPTLMNAADGKTSKVLIGTRNHKVTPEVARYIERLERTAEEDKAANSQLNAMLEKYLDVLAQKDTFTEELKRKIKALRAENISLSKSLLAAKTQKTAPFIPAPQRTRAPRDPLKRTTKQSPLAQNVLYAEAAATAARSGSPVPPQRAQSTEPYKTRSDLEDEIKALRSQLASLQSEIQILKTHKAPRQEVALPKAGLRLPVARQTRRPRSRSLSTISQLGAIGEE